MTVELAEPLMQDQIDAAHKLYKLLPRWRRKEELLDELKKIDPDILDIDATLLKIMAVNKFYFTNVKATDWMARNIVNEVMPKRGTIPDVDFVLLLASGPVRKHRSFGAKFAHFFISKEDYPIYDSYAEQTVSFHIRTENRVKVSGETHVYKAFYENLNNLMRWASLSGSYEAVDRYLWLAGLYRSWLRSKSNEKEPEINQEVRELFKKSESQPLLKQLFPYVPGEGNQWIPVEAK